MTAQTVYKRCERDSIEDRSHILHRLCSTLTPSQGSVAMALFKTLLLPLDDLLAAVREFLKRHDVGVEDQNINCARRLSGESDQKPNVLPVDDATLAKRGVFAAEIDCKRFNRQEHARACCRITPWQPLQNHEACLVAEKKSESCFKSYT